MSQLTIYPLECPQKPTLNKVLADDPCSIFGRGEVVDGGRWRRTNQKKWSSVVYLLGHNGTVAVVVVLNC